MLTATDLANRVIQLYLAGVPDVIESVTLGSRDAREAGYTSVTYANARRVAPSMDDELKAGAANEHIIDVWALLKTTEATDPKVGDKITDSASVVCHIKHIDKKLMGRNFRCICTRE